ncbi:hypothetical protein ABOM_006068 [Aspergillus bombycis]|uniref:Uncharacterized protein n=1 Tax=Aspergillus bombycis TaxID=109264 RepID=A0A1F8A336_9EURO|nr:hypothetical protein ABOM_006068 [Aspergillus bombycis]OGM45839.1 hypothetical protein ABOM_006068 [Aspergillus bombycis]
MQFKTLLSSLFIASASAGWIQLCSSDGHCTDAGSSPANSNNCMGPIRGKPPFKFVAHDFTPVSMSIFTDKGCWNNNVATCDGCKDVKYKGKGPVYGIFHMDVV